MRVFTAIDLSEEARTAVVEAQQRAARTVQGSAIRFVRPEHLHLTLAFVGNLQEDRVAELTTRLTEDMPEECFELAFGGFGVFPAAGAPRVLWLGIVRGLDETKRLQHVVTERLRVVGVEPDQRPFRPHLTLGRWSDGRRSDRPRALIGGDFVPTMLVREVTLYQSRPTSSGPSYTALAHARLRDPMASH